MKRDTFDLRFDRSNPHAARSIRQAWLLPGVVMLFVSTPAVAQQSDGAAAGKQPAETSADDADGDTSADADPDDMADGFVDLLSEAERPRWLGDGRTEQARSNQRGRWTFEGDLLRCAGKQYGFLRYDRKVCDFALRLEFRLSTAGGNSGIGIRGLPYREHSTRPSVVAYELQILDDAGKPPSGGGNMALYHLRPPIDNQMRPVGEWNRLEVVCRGPQLTVTLNGTTVQDVDQSQHKRLRAKPLCGYILLQNHGNPVDFRRIELKVFEPAAEAGGPREKYRSNDS